MCNFAFSDNVVIKFEIAEYKAIIFCVNLHCISRVVRKIQYIALINCGFIYIGKIISAATRENVHKRVAVSAVGI